MAPEALLLWPGAGGNRDHRHLIAIEDAVDLPARRLDFAYRQLGPRRPPPRSPRLVAELAQVVPEVAAELGVAPERLVLGGRSMGGRICSLAVAEGLPAAGLVLLSYPLHPPGKPEKLRVEHFGKLDVPCLFVSGDRDPFGRPPEWPEHLRAIPGEVTMVWLEGDGHDPKRNEQQLVEAVVDWVRALE